MTIYYICAVDISNYDAQRTHILEVVREMDFAGEAVTLFLPQFQESPEKLPFRHRYIPVFFKNSKFKFIEYEIRLFGILLAACLKNRPDLIFTRKGFLTLVPCFIAMLLGIRTIIEVNGIIADEVRVSFGLPHIATRFFAAIERICYRMSDRVVVVTEGLKTYLVNKYKVPGGQIRIIQNGVNCRRFYSNHYSKAVPLQLGFVGNLVKWSGVEYLIRSIPEVLRHHPRARYMIVGDGILRQDLEALARELQVAENVEFVGKVLPGEVPAYINRCQICYIPAIIERNAEIGGSPLKLYEYLSCGRPVIVSDINGLDIVAEHDLGTIVPPEDPAAIAAATLALLESPRKMEEISVKARQTAVRHFSWQRTTAEILSLSQELLNPAKKF